MNCATTNKQVCKRRNELRDYKQNKCVRGAMNSREQTNRLTICQIGIRISVSILDKMDPGKE